MAPRTSDGLGLIKEVIDDGTESGYTARYTWPVLCEGLRLAADLLVASQRTGTATPAAAAEPLGHLATLAGSLSNSTPAGRGYRDVSLAAIARADGTNAVHLWQRANDS
jgi:hypothetical protein